MSCYVVYGTSSITKLTPDVVMFAAVGALRRAAAYQLAQRHLNSRLFATSKFSSFSEQSKPVRESKSKPKQTEVPEKPVQQNAVPDADKTKVSNLLRNLVSGDESASPKVTQPVSSNIPPMSSNQSQSGSKPLKRFGASSSQGSTEAFKSRSRKALKPEQPNSSISLDPNIHPPSFDQISSTPLTETIPADFFSTKSSDQSSNTPSPALPVVSASVSVSRDVLLESAVNSAVSDFLSPNTRKPVKAARVVTPQQRTKKSETRSPKVAKPAVIEPSGDVTIPSPPSTSDLSFWSVFQAEVDSNGPKSLESVSSSATEQSEAIPLYQSPFQDSELNTAATLAISADPITPVVETATTPTRLVIQDAPKVVQIQDAPKASERSEPHQNADIAADKIELSAAEWDIVRQATSKKSSASEWKSVQQRHQDDADSSNSTESGMHEEDADEPQITVDGALKVSEWRDEPEDFQAEEVSPESAVQENSKPKLKVAQNLVNMTLSDSEALEANLTNRGRRRLARQQLQRQSPEFSSEELAAMSPEDRRKYESTMSLLEKVEAEAVPFDPHARAAPHHCSGCGATLQIKHAKKPGFMSPERMQKLIAAKAEARKARESALEEEFKLQAGATETDAVKSDVTDALQDVPEEKRDEVQGVLALESMPHLAALENGTLGGERRKKHIVCNRCHDLTHYSGNGDAPTIEPEDFRVMLQREFERRGGERHVLIKVADVFDFDGSFVRDLPSLIGDRGNPIILALNKIDLLPHDAKLPRIREWARQRARALGVEVDDVVLVSGAFGTNVRELLQAAAKAAIRRHSEAAIYVVGAANVGKSTLINKMIGERLLLSTGRGQRPAFDPLTVSNRPGTTLGLSAFALAPAVQPGSGSGKGILLFDSPGVSDPGHIWNQLNTQELKAVIPSRKLKPVAYRLGAGSSLLIGGLARIDIVEGLPFFLTVYAAPEVTVHVTEVYKAASVLQKHTSGLLTPPFDASRSVPANSPLHISDTPAPFDIRGSGWLQAACDLVIPGLGWVAFTGCGPFKIDVFTPKTINVSMRSPSLLPFETIRNTKKYAGPRKNRY